MKKKVTYTVSVPIDNQKEIEALVAAALNYMKASEIIAEMVANKYCEKFKEEAHWITEEIIDSFYDYSTPYEPKRVGSLYSAFKIIGDVKDDEVGVLYDSSYMDGFEHHQDNQIIYNNVFVNGYHGGSYGKPDKLGVSVGKIPHYRKPPKSFVYWGRPADQDDSPIEQIDGEISELIKKLHEEATKEANELVHPYLAEIEKCLYALRR